MLRELKLLLKQQNNLKKKKVGKSKVSYPFLDDFSGTWQGAKKVYLTEDQLDNDIRKTINGDDTQISLSTYLLYSLHIDRMIEGLPEYELVFPMGLKRQNPKVYIMPHEYEFAKFLICKGQSIVIDVNSGTLFHTHDQNMSVDIHWVDFYKSIAQSNEIEVILGKVEKNKDLLLMLNKLKYADARDVAFATAEYFF